MAALAALNADGIVPVLLKGAVHLTLPQAEWHQARAMRDLDILVRAEHAERANKILSSNSATGRTPTRRRSTVTCRS